MCARGALGATARKLIALSEPWLYFFLIAVPRKPRCAHAPCVHPTPQAAFDESHTGLCTARQHSHPLIATAQKFTSLNWHNRALQLEETDTCAPRPTTRSVECSWRDCIARGRLAKRMCMPSRGHGVSCGRLLPVKVERAQQRRRDATYDLSRACCCNNTACAPPCNSCTGVAEPCTASSQPIWQCANPAFHVAHSDC